MVVLEPTMQLNLASNSRQATLLQPPKRLDYRRNPSHPANISEQVEYVGGWTMALILAIESVSGIPPEDRL